MGDRIMQSLYSYKKNKNQIIKIKNTVTVKARKCAPVTAEKTIYVTTVKPSITYQNGINFLMFIILFLMLSYGEFRTTSF